MKSFKQHLQEKHSAVLWHATPLNRSGEILKSGVIKDHKRIPGNSLNDSNHLEMIGRSVFGHSKYESESEDDNHSVVREWLRRNNYKGMISFARSMTGAYGIQLTKYHIAACYKFSGRGLSRYGKIIPTDFFQHGRHRWHRNETEDTLLIKGNTEIPIDPSLEEIRILMSKDDYDEMRADTAESAIRRRGLQRTETFSQTKYPLSMYVVNRRGWEDRNSGLIKRVDMEEFFR